MLKTGKLSVEIIHRVLPNDSYKNFVFVEIPEGITEIGKYAFRGCSKLERIRLPDSLERIGNNAFENCTSLRTVHLPENVYSLGDCCFAGCDSLTGIKLNDKLRRLNCNSFEYCESLEYVYIPQREMNIFHSSDDCFGTPWGTTIHTFENIKVASIPSGAEDYDDWLDNCNKVEKIFIRIETDRYRLLDMDKYSEVKAKHVEIVWLKSGLMFDIFLLGLLRILEDYDVLDGCNIAIDYIWPCFSFEVSGRN